MNSLYILIPIALILVVLAVAVFLWAAKSGQFDDLDTEGKRILFDKDEISPAKKTDTNDEP